jgi:cell division septation protein DedD
MPRNEEGEFELVLGNRQLLSVFFIVVVLLGVFFVMGYILGKNSSPAPGSDVAGARKPAEAPATTNPIIIDKPGPKSSAAVSPVPEKPAEKTEAKPEARKEEPKKEAAVKQPAPKEEPKKEETKAAAAGSEVGMGVPPKGSYFLQVAAVGRAEADLLVKVLKGKGFNTWIAPSDNEQIFRVLVGPMQRSEKGDFIEKLTGLGFKPFPRSY